MPKVDKGCIIIHIQHCPIPINKKKSCYLIVYAHFHIFYIPLRLPTCSPFMSLLYSSPRERIENAHLAPHQWTHTGHCFILRYKNRTSPKRQTHDARPPQRQVLIKEILNRQWCCYENIRVIKARAWWLDKSSKV